MELRDTIKICTANKDITHVNTHNDRTSQAARITFTEETGHVTELKSFEQLDTESSPQSTLSSHLSDKEINISPVVSVKNVSPTPKPRQQQLKDLTRTDVQSFLKEDVATNEKHVASITQSKHRDMEKAPIITADVTQKTMDSSNSGDSSLISSPIVKHNQIEIHSIEKMREEGITSAAAAFEFSESSDKPSTPCSPDAQFHSLSTELIEIGKNIEIEKDGKDLQTSFYIGELSSNIIIKSKPSQREEGECGEIILSKETVRPEAEGRSPKRNKEYCEKSPDHVREPEMNKVVYGKISQILGEEDCGKHIVSENSAKCFDGSILTEKCHAEELGQRNILFQDNKVVRQWSETRNDLLEIETDSQKRSNEKSELSNISSSEPLLSVQHSISQNVLETKISTETISTAFDSKKYDIDVGKKKEAETAFTADTSLSTKGVKLDLVLDKSEIEVSEKSCALSSTRISADMTETMNIDSIPLDVLLVERTLEEVKLSLDAAKEELIQVVRDGKSIKQSPSEFEFKNMSNSKGSEKLSTNKEVGKCVDIIESPCTVLAEYPENVELQPSDAKQFVSITNEFNQQVVTKSFVPQNNRSSIHEIDNSSSSDSYYKSGSRPCSSDFETVQTFQTSSEYQTALDASICRESTEYVSAASTFDSSGKTISSHESMRSLSSEISANLGSMEASDFSETLVASMEDHEREQQDQTETDCILDDDLCTQFQEELCLLPVDVEIQQSSMKRSQEMIFTAVEKGTEIISPHCQPSQVEVLKVLNADKIILDIGSLSEIEHFARNSDDLLHSECPTSLLATEMLMSTNEDEDTLHSIETHNIESTHNFDTFDTATHAEESLHRGHTRSESTLVDTDLIKNPVDDKNENLPIENVDRNITLTGSVPVDEQRGSGSESDHDPYESEYSRAFKSPTQRKKRKEKKNIEALDQGPENSYGPLDLVTQTIIEDIVTEEIESQTTADYERRPSQNMQDYSNIPDITVTEEMCKNEESEQFSESPLYKVKTEAELHKVEDTPMQRAIGPIGPIATCASNEEFDELVQQQYKQKLADLHGSIDFEKKLPDSPDSFELVEQPDITDEFVVIEEVAKEANEFDIEGKSIRISSSKIIKKHDEEIEKILINSAPAATNLGSLICHDDLNFDFEESPPSVQAENEKESSETAANKKWVEMQLSDHAAQLRYPYELERGILEDITEEDVEYEIGSSRISSFKDSLSSTSDYDVLAGRKYFSKPEHDDVSMSSLQEFESLEQAISLENRRILQGSIDSSNGSFTRRYMIKNPCNDDISLSSLKDFEGLENACIEAHLIEIKAKEEAALLLSRSDESNNSCNGVENSNEAVENISKKSISIKNVKEVLKSQSEEHQSTVSAEMEMSTDSLEAETDPSTIKFIASEHGSVDSLEMKKSIELLTSSIDSFEMTKDVSDLGSLHPKQTFDPTPIEAKLENTFKQVYSIDETSLESNLMSTSINTTVLEKTDICKNFSYDSLNICIEQSSSAATNATYNEGESMMTDSMTSCGSSTLMEDSPISYIINSSTQPVAGECEQFSLETQYDLNSQNKKV